MSFSTQFNTKEFQKTGKKLSLREKIWSNAGKEYIAVNEAINGDPQRRVVYQTRYTNKAIAYIKLVTNLHLLCGISVPENTIISEKPGDENPYLKKPNFVFRNKPGLLQGNLFKKKSPDSAPYTLFIVQNEIDLQEGKKEFLYLVAKKEPNLFTLDEVLNLPAEDSYEIFIENNKKKLEVLTSQNLNNKPIRGLYENIGVFAFLHNYEVLGSICRPFFIFEGKFRELDTHFEFVFFPSSPKVVTRYLQSSNNLELEKRNLLPLDQNNLLLIDFMSDADDEFHLIKVFRNLSLEQKKEGLRKVLAITDSAIELTVRGSEGAAYIPQDELEKIISVLKKRRDVFKSAYQENLQITQISFNSCNSTKPIPKMNQDVLEQLDKDDFSFTKDTMAMAVAYKKTARNIKKLDFNCIVLDRNNNGLDELEEFLEFLAKNKHNTPDNARMQVIINTDEHWTVLDIKIKAGKAHFFIVDAANDLAAIIATIMAISHHHPESRIFYDAGNIQHDTKNCGSFATEHAFLLSKITHLHEELEKIYDRLEDHFDYEEYIDSEIFGLIKELINFSHVQIIDNASTIYVYHKVIEEALKAAKQVSYFHISQTPLILSPIFRNMQSLSMLETMFTQHKKVASRPQSKNTADDDLTTYAANRSFNIQTTNGYYKKRNLGIFAKGMNIRNKTKEFVCDIDEDVCINILKNRSNYSKHLSSFLIPDDEDIQFSLDCYSTKKITKNC